ncbi:MAG: hypothetical protein FJZ15_02065 [Candidatus Omnitrophica bacterium]|nr:hypothetical protein [Candidatus Omnitrophota bacterium]
MKQATASIKITLFSLIFLYFFIPFSSALAVFDLSYNLTEGGTNRLELDQKNQYKGVRLNISSDISVRYEVSQRIVQQLESRDKPGLSIRDNFVFRGLRGSNRFGDLRASSADTPLRQEELLYVSSVSGNSDSFTLVYGIIRPEELEPGDYYGRIAFTLNPMGGTVQQATQILEVHVSISREQAAKQQIEITTPTGSKRVVLNPKKDLTRAASVIIKVNGKFKQPFTIKQALIQPPESLDGERLSSNALSFAVKDAVKGAPFSGLVSLTAFPQNIYKSAPDAETDNNITVVYSLGDLSQQKAGKYRTRIQYLLEQAGVESRIESLELDIENDPVFDLVVVPQDNKYIVEFRGLKPKSPPQINEVVIEIKTNLGKRYQVVQDISSELRNKEGRAIPGQFFNFETRSLDTKGKLNFPVKQQVKSGGSTLFISDEKGSPDKFKVIYELGCSEEVQPGDYSANVAYSLLEI